MRAEFLKQSGVGEQFILERATHRLKLGVKIIVKEYVPRHGRIMFLKTYNIKTVFQPFSISKSIRRENRSST
ncbi:MAG: hypothetical protein AAB278_04075 [Pseudomonadota bacterium]